MQTVACVWKAGPEYRLEHVLALAAGVQRNLAIPHRFVCLTDCGAIAAQIMIRAGIEPIPLKHGWLGWWSKIELFRPGLFDGPVFYADLDTIVIAPIADLVEGHRFTVLRNFWVKPGHLRIGSGLMAWDCDLSHLYHRFAVRPATIMDVHKTTESWGDQGFIQAHSPVRPERWQDKFPGRVCSYKKHVLTGDGKPPEGASIICYHGQPRPWQTPLWECFT
jgi:hypothetical protein